MPRRKPDPEKAPRKKAKPRAARKPQKNRNTEGLMPGGHNEHVPTPEARQTVANAAGIGLQHAMIATLIGVSENTLRKHYQLELDSGRARATFKVAAKLFNRAESGDLGAMIFWLKAQAGWREKHVLDEPEGKSAITLAAMVLASGLDDSKANGLPPGGA